MKSISKKVLGLLVALVVLVNSIGMLALTASAANETLIVSASTTDSEGNPITKVAQGEKFIVTYKMENYAAFYAAHGSANLKTSFDQKFGKLYYIAVFFDYDDTAFEALPEYDDVTGEPNNTFGTLTTPYTQTVTVPGNGAVNFLWESTGAYAKAKADSMNDGYALSLDNADMFQVEFKALADVELQEYNFNIIEDQMAFYSWKKIFENDYANVTGVCDDYPYQANGFSMTIENAASVDYTILEDAIADAQDALVGITEGEAEGNYTPESVATLEDAIEVAQGALTATEQAVVDAAAGTLNTATAAFLDSVVHINKTALATAIGEANIALAGATPGFGLNQYPPNAYAAFSDAIDLAQDVYDDPAAIQGDVNDAVTDLVAAQVTFLGTKITNPKDADSTIKKFSLTNGTLDVPFNSATTTYTITVARATNWINIFPFIGSKATFRYLDANDVEIPSNYSFNSLPCLHFELATSTKTLKIEVTAENTTKTVYTFNVVRPLVVSGLSVTFGTCTGINDETKTINVVANESASYVNIAPYVAPGITYTINGETKVYASIDVKGPASKSAQVVINDANGVPVPYTVNITRALSTDNSVKGVALTNATISGSVITATSGSSFFYMVPIIAGNAQGYTLYVGSNPTPVVTYTSGAYITAKIPSVAGTTIKVVVVSESGAPVDHFYTVERAQSTNKALTGISLSYATKDATTIYGTNAKGIFYMLPYVTEYATARVFNDVTGDELFVNSTKAIPISKASGITRIRIEVTAESGGTPAPYIYNVVFN